ncbi:MAG: hypothetical protein RLZZ84_1021 [Pseudomonadota bacterium]|jgi:uncharacterized protein (TIGR02001 family)
MLTYTRGPIAALLLAGCGLAAAPAFADETDAPSAFSVTGNAAVVSDYRFRGISLSGGDPALQGAIQINHASGLYAGVWGSQLQDTAVYGSVETDFYAGWTGQVANGLTADVGMTYYAYFDGKVGSANLYEPYASLSATLGPASAKLGVAYGWKQDALGGDDNLYLYTDWGMGVPGTAASVSAHLGHTSGALSPNRLTGKNANGGFDYAIGATYAITPRLSAGVSYVGVDGTARDGMSNDAIVGSLKYSF